MSRTNQHANIAPALSVNKCVVCATLINPSATAKNCKDYGNDILV